jgi:hypothetical protein
LNSRYHWPGARRRTMLSRTVPGHCSHPAGTCPGATSSTRADGVPHTAQGGVTTIGVAMCAQALAPWSRSAARAFGVLACALAYTVEGIFDGFPIQDAVAALDALPRADSAQLYRGDPWSPCRGRPGARGNHRARTQGGRKMRSERWRGPGGHRLPGTSRAPGRQRSPQPA